MNTLHRSMLVSLAAIAIFTIPGCFSDITSEEQDLIYMVHAHGCQNMSTSCKLHYSPAVAFGDEDQIGLGVTRRNDHTVVEKIPFGTKSRKGKPSEHEYHPIDGGKIWDTLEELGCTHDDKCSVQGETHDTKLRKFILATIGYHKLIRGKVVLDIKIAKGKRTVIIKGTEKRKAEVL